MTYRYIYKITCTAGSFNGKFYYGQHTTDNLDDGYKGSGVLIQKYYKKHPDDYIKEIISYHNSEEELNKAEYDIIKYNLECPMCLNLMQGGHGGRLSDSSYKKSSETQKGRIFSEESKRKMSESHKGQIPWNKDKTGVYSEEILQKMSESRKGKGIGKRNLSEETRKKLATNKGKHIPEETRKKISESLKGNIPWNKGKIGVSEETREKMRQAWKIRKNKLYKNNER